MNSELKPFGGTNDIAIGVTVDDDDATLDAVFAHMNRALGISRKGTKEVETNLGVFVPEVAEYSHRVSHGSRNRSRSHSSDMRELHFASKAGKSGGKSLKIGILGWTSSALSLMF